MEDDKNTKEKVSLYVKFLTFQMSMSYKLKADILQLLNWYERFWRSETIKDLKSKYKKSPSPEIQERIDYEEKMLAIADSNRTINNLADIVNKMKEKGWF